MEILLIVSLCRTFGFKVYLVLGYICRSLTYLWWKLLKLFKKAFVNLFCIKLWSHDCENQPALLLSQRIWKPPFNFFCWQKMHFLKDSITKFFIPILFFSKHTCLWPMTMINKLKAVDKFLFSWIYLISKVSFYLANTLESQLR